MKTYPLPEDEQIEIIGRLANKELMEELVFLRDGVEHDEPYTFLDAFDDAQSQADGNPDCNKSYVKNIREIQIALGDYIEITEDEISRTVCMGGRRKAWYFKLNGKKYKFNSSNETPKEWK